MLERLLHFSIHHRVLVVLLTAFAAVYGATCLLRLPIDAVPDITNNQVQINIEVPALAPEQVEKQVTFPVETALAGIDGLEQTRSLSRNGFSQVTAIFSDATDVYFARAQVLERLTTLGSTLPPGAEPMMGPLSTGLGEVFMYVVEYEHPGGAGAPINPGAPGWQPDGTYRTPEGETLATDVERAAYLRTLQEFVIAPQLRSVADLAGVDSIGGYAKQYSVEPDPMKLVSHGLTFARVIDALEANNAAASARYVEAHGEAWQVRSSGLLENLADISGVVVGSDHGTPITVGDVANVTIRGELRTGSASENGDEVVVGTALMRVGGNSRTVAAAVGTRLDEINPTLPPGVQARAVLDRTKLVDRTIRTVQKNLAEGALLVVVVLFLLLGNVRAALLTALAIPLSMLLTAAGMVHAGISGNLLSLGAIDFGIIIDGSVIIVENCVRRLAERQRELGRTLTLAERLETTFAAAKQVRTATAFGEAIIIIVFLPVLFLTGVEGKMFTPMAATVIFALVAAFVLSLTFIPAAVAIVMRGPIREKEVAPLRWAKAVYAPLLNRALHLRWAVVGLAVVAFTGAALLFTQLGQEFVPQLDEGDLAMHSLRMPSTSLSMSQTLQLDVERAVGSIPEVQTVFSKTGTAEVASDPMPPNVSDGFVILKEKAEWRPLVELLEHMRALEDARPAEPADAHAGHDDHAEAGGHEGHGPAPLNERDPKSVLTRIVDLTAQTVPGANYEITQPIEMRFNELVSGVRSDVAVKVFGDDFGLMVPAAEAIAEAMRGVPGAASVTVEQTEGLPGVDVLPDRDALGRRGLTVTDVQDLVSAAVGGRHAGMVFQGDRRFDLVVRLPEELRGDLGTLSQLPVPLPVSHGQPDPDDIAAGDYVPAPPPFVPLGDLADIRVATGLNQVSRENGKRRVVVQVAVSGRDLGSFVDDAKAAIATEAPPPPGTYLRWGGQFENLERARARLRIVVPICFALIFLLLYTTFGNAKDAAMVFICVPLALTGGVVALWLRGIPFSISAAVGFIALSGVAVLNGLVMVVFINQLREQGVDP